MEVILCFGAGCSPGGHLTEISKKIVETAIFFERFCSDVQQIIFVGGSPLETEKMKCYAVEIGSVCQSLLVAEGESLHQKVVASLDILSKMEKGSIFWVIDHEVRMKRTHLLLKRIGRLYFKRKIDLFPYNAEAVYDDLSEKKYWSSPEKLRRRESWLYLFSLFRFPLWGQKRLFL